jgi:hypothetical protein
LDRCQNPKAPTLEVEYGQYHGLQGAHWNLEADPALRQDNREAFDGNSEETDQPRAQPGSRARRGRARPRSALRGDKDWPVGNEVRKAVKKVGNIRKKVEREL